MTNEYILHTAMAQSAIDSGCEMDDFTKSEPVIVESRPHPDARRYLTLPFFLDLTSYGSNVVASGSPEILGFAAKYIARDDFCHCFETPAIYELNRELAKYGQHILYMAEYFLPDVGELERASERIRGSNRGFETRLLHKSDFAPLYTPEWSNALCAHRAELDTLGVGAYDGERLIGLAACSADCDSMYQIGIDVLPEYRRCGIAKTIVTRLAQEIIKLGKVPFYCAAWSNVRSVRCALASGFKPAWVQITAKPIE